MEFLNKTATIIFGKLKDRMRGAQHRKIANEPYMPLTIEHIGQHIETSWGSADLYSLCHYYEQNGDLMQDPEMCFFAIDKREGFTESWERLKVAPYMFQQPNADIFQRSVLMDNNRLTKFHRKQQRDHTVFANQWLANIRQQGFLNQ